MMDKKCISAQSLFRCPQYFFDIKIKIWFSFLPNFFLSLNSLAVRAFLLPNSSPISNVSIYRTKAKSKKQKTVHFLFTSWLRKTKPKKWLIEKGQGGINRCKLEVAACRRRREEHCKDFVSRKKLLFRSRKVIPRGTSH